MVNAGGMKTFQGSAPGHVADDHPRISPLTLWLIRDHTADGRASRKFFPAEGWIALQR